MKRRTGGWLLLGLAACVLVVVFVDFVVDHHGADHRVQHASIGELSFDYPADWTLTLVGNPRHYQMVIAFLVSPGAAASESCGPGYIPGNGPCEDTFAVPAGSAVVRFSIWDGPPIPRGTSVIAQLLQVGWQPVTVAGQPAAYTDRDASVSALGARTVEWRIAAPGPDDMVSYEIDATIGGSQADFRAQVDSLLATLRIAQRAIQP